MAKYKRVLIKLSGEALGDHGRLFDFDQIDRVADVIRQLHETGTEIAIVIGAGNIWRGRQGPAAKMTAVSASRIPIAALSAIWKRGASSSLPAARATHSSRPIRRLLCARLKSARTPFCWQRMWTACMTATRVSIRRQSCCRM